MPVALAAAAVAVLTSAALAQTGRIIAIGDEWLLSDEAFMQQPAQTQQLALNIAGYFSGATGNFLVLSNSGPAGGVSGQRGVLGSALGTLMTGSGHGWDVNPGAPLTLATLQNYDAVFLSGNLGSGAANASVLAQYVLGGGSVLVMAGTGDMGSAQGEADAWNPFLNQFGLGFGAQWFTTTSDPAVPLVSVPTLPSSHPLGALVNGVRWGFGQTALDLDASDPLNQVALLGNFTGLPGPAPSGDISAVPIIATYNVLVPAPGAAALAMLTGAAALGRRRR
ncbi:MAG: hypothetical protein K2Q09_01305 [Phycisphaerales bacterium]|nr:hypothetical protein [Phycisphaerales bacterium]